MLTISQVTNREKHIKEIYSKKGIREAQLYIQELYYKSKNIAEYNLFHLYLNGLIGQAEKNKGQD